jgi:hypothetical protein
MTQPAVPLKTALQLAASVGGIYGAYLTQGIIQETLSTKKFGPEGERFTHLSSLNAVQSWACFLWAFLLLRFFEREKQAGYPPFTAYWKAAVTNCIGPACGYEALKYISYPAQVLAKSSKMIPVMLIGTVLHGKSYSVLEYVCCLMVSGAHPRGDASGAGPSVCWAGGPKHVQGAGTIGAEARGAGSSLSWSNWRRWQRQRQQWIMVPGASSL